LTYPDLTHLSAIVNEHCFFLLHHITYKTFSGVLLKTGAMQKVVDETVKFPYVNAKELSIQFFYIGVLQYLSQKKRFLAPGHV
jgi:hypothetical protein